MPARLARTCSGSEETFVLYCDVEMIPVASSDHVVLTALSRPTPLLLDIQPVIRTIGVLYEGCLSLETPRLGSSNLT